MVVLVVPTTGSGGVVRGTATTSGPPMQTKNPRPKVQVHKPSLGKPVALPTRNGEPNNKLHEILEQIKSAVEYEERLDKAKAAYYLSTAFQKTTLRGLLNLTPTLNKVGDLRGIVLSAEGRAAFTALKDVSEKWGFVGTAIGMLDQAWQQRDKIADLAESNAPWDEKLGHASAIVTSMLSRSLGEALIAPVSVAPWVAQHMFHQDMTDVNEQLTHVETELRCVTDPDNIEAGYVYVRSYILTKIVLW
jgi:hypothetical protein